MKYEAGFFDGEGTISFQKQKNSFSSFVSIDNTNREAIEQMANLMGTKVEYIAKPNKSSTKGIYVARIGKREDIINFLNKILPHLKIKRKQGELMLEWCKSRLSYGKKRGGPRYTEREIEIIYTVRELNQ